MNSHKVFRVILYVMLAFDIVATHLVPLSHVGIAGFNVAHAWWAEWWPVSLEHNFALLMMAALGALCSACWQKQWMSWLTFLAYTLAWSSTMIDSYQHHALMSWLLLGLCFEDKVAMKLNAITLAAMYGFTVVAKCNPAWWMGETLSRANTVGFDFHGLSVANAARLTLFVEGVLCVVYALKALQVKEQEYKHVYWFAGLMGVLFHYGTLELKLDIGWFAYYMMVINGVWMMPEPVWDKFLGVWPKSKPLLCAAVLVVLWLLSPFVFKPHYDFYRFRGGDLARVIPSETNLQKKKEMIQEAILMYEDANRYASKPEERRDSKLQGLQTQLEQLNAK